MTGLELAPLAALLPSVIDFGGKMFDRFFGSAKPQNVGEYVQLSDADTRRLQALAALDQGGQSYRWVAAVRELQLPAVVVAVIGTYVAGGEVDGLPQFAAAVGFYLFGERFMVTRKKRGG